MEGFPIGLVVDTSPLQCLHKPIGLTLYQPMMANAVMTFVKSPLAYGNLYGGYNTRRCTLVHGFCLFKLFLLVGKELI